MRVLIGNHLIHRITPSKKQYDIRDTKLPGFLIRVNPSGKMFYVCQFKRGRRINIGRVGILTPAQARDKARAILGDVAKGLDPTNPSKKKTGLTLNEFINEHYRPWIIEHRKNHVKTLDHIKRCFIKPFGEKALADITPVLLDQWRTKRLKSGLTVETVNREAATFKAAISKAVLWGLIEKHPLDKFKLLKSDRSGKIRFLSAEEEQNLREAALNRESIIKTERARANQWRAERNYSLYTDLNQFVFADHMRPMILLSINTGLRRGELFSLKWENVHLNQAMLTIEGSYAKSGRTRHIPLNSEALHVIKSWRKQTENNDLVFPSKDGKRFDTIKSAWKSICNKSEIKNFRWHDLRHHFASKLVMAGVDLNTVRELLGHSDMAMTLRYAHLAPEHKANAVEKLINFEAYKKNQSI